VWERKSFADDLNKARGIVSGRVSLLVRSTEIQPLFLRFVYYKHDWFLSSAHRWFDFVQVVFEFSIHSSASPCECSQHGANVVLCAMLVVNSLNHSSHFILLSMPILHLRRLYVFWNKLWIEVAWMPYGSIWHQHAIGVNGVCGCRDRGKMYGKITL
jgi:hypothetical protein